MSSKFSAHTVVEQLQAFRYVATTRELAWKDTRSIDLGKLRVHAPDLQQLKHLTSCLSDCALPSLTELQAAAPSEVLQLLGVFQSLLQFSLHSQGVLRHQVSAKQTALSVEKVTSQQMSALEARLELAKKKLDDAATEREATRITFHNMEKQIVELRTANGLLERELEFHRNTQRLITASKSTPPEGYVVVPAVAAVQQPQQKNNGAEPRHLVDGVHQAPSQQQQPHQQHVSKSHKSRRHHGADSTASATSWDEEELRQRSNRRSTSGARQQRPKLDAPSGQYVDWQSFAALLMTQQHQPHPWGVGASSVQSPTSPVAAHQQPIASTARPDEADVAAARRAAEQQQHVHEQQMKDVLKALQSGLETNRVQLLQQTQETMGHVEAGIAHRITKLQQEQRAMQDALSTQVSQNETHFSQAVNKLSAQMVSLKTDTEDQIRVLRGDVGSAISSMSRQTSVANNAASAPSSNIAAATPAAVTVTQTHQTQRSMSPNVLPPLPLAQVQQDLNNTSGPIGMYSKHQGSPVGTPGSVFGPRVVSATVSHSGDHPSSSDDDADSPYVPMSKQQTAPAGISGTSTPLPAAVTVPAATTVPAVETPLGVTVSSLNVSGLDASVNQALTRKASSQLLKDTQDELQRLLDEEAAAEEAKKARLAAK